MTSFTRVAPHPRRIAVIGGGISGMGAAYGTARSSHVSLFEAERRLGGHARTVLAGQDSPEPVDTGFIVFNYATYPHLTKLFAELEVPVVHSTMSFGASIGGGRLEYGLASMRALFAQKRNLGDPRFLRMVRDLLRFNRRAEATVRARPELTVGELIAALGLGRTFRDCYLTPFSGAIWSTPKARVLDFPAAALVGFFRNHGLLGVYGQHQWYTVAGGSHAYVERLGQAMHRRGVEMRLGAKVEAIRRGVDGVDVRARGGEWERFDEVVLACHSDQALALLSDARPEERACLGAIRYQPNEVVLHSDASVMPRSRAVWSSWNYAEPAGGPSEHIDVTYWMNSLQPWLRRPLFVTLNGQQPVQEDLIWDAVTMDHPVYGPGVLAAQEGLRERNGRDGTWFCGAWMRSGFHEDGLASAVDVVRALEARARPALAVAAE